MTDRLDVGQCHLPKQFSGFEFVEQEQQDCAFLRTGEVGVDHAASPAGKSDRIIWRTTAEARPTSAPTSCFVSASFSA